MRAERRWGKANAKSRRCSEQVKCSCFRGGPGRRAESGGPVVQVGDAGVLQRERVNGAGSVLKVRQTGLIDGLQVGGKERRIKDDV